jgi:glycosyltransferase 2 family protein
MSRRVKKAALLALKIAILAGLLEYARRQSQIADEIAMPARGAVPVDERGQIALTTVDGSPAHVEPGARLKVVDVRRTADGAPLAYRVATPPGPLVDIPASDVDGSPAARATGRPAPFSLLPGLLTLFRELDLRYLGLAFAAFGPPLFLMAVRWRILLAAAGVTVPFWILIRLHYLGFFFNTFMPGGTGGDIIKAVYVTRHSSQKTEAATMVLIDRIIGLVGVLMMSAAVVVFDYREVSGIALEVGVISLSLTTSFVLFFSASFRKLVRYDVIIEKLPKSDVLKKVDRALLSLRNKKADLFGALALTIGLQLVVMVAVWCAGHALGIHKAKFVHYVAFVPIGYLFNALPISFGGVGLMEGAYLKLFRDAGVATATQGFMVGVLVRLISLGWSLLGAVSALFPPERIEVVPEGAGRAKGEI